MEEREFKWGYSSSKGYYIGYKLTLAIEYPSLRPVAFILHQGSPSDAKIYIEILEELKRRRIALNGDTIIFDRGYYAYKNYVPGISVFNVISLIFPKKNVKMGKLMEMLSSPLSIFDRSNLGKEKKFYKGLVKRLREKIDSWKNYKPVRGTIEDIFK